MKNTTKKALAFFLGCLLGIPIYVSCLFGLRNAYKTETNKTSDITLTEITETDAHSTTETPITETTETTETKFVDTDIETEYTPTEFRYDIKEVVYLAKVIAAEGGSSQMEKAAVVWCILNRVDSDRFANDIISVITSPNQFAISLYVYDSNIDLAIDVLTRWYREKNGETDVGRVLPKDYCYFRGFKWTAKATELGMPKPTRSHNWFFTVSEYNKSQYERNYWNWSLPNPY